MIAFLVGRRIHREGFVLRRRHIELQFAHRMEIHACPPAESVAGLHQGVFRRAVQPAAVLVEEGAEEARRGTGGEGVEEHGPEPRNHVEVAVARLDEGEEARTVHPLAVAENRLQIVIVVHGEVQGLEPAVGGRIHEVHHLDAVGFDKIQCFLNIHGCFSVSGFHVRARGTPPASRPRRRRTRSGEPSRFRPVRPRLRRCWSVRHIRGTAMT